MRHSARTTSGETTHGKAMPSSGHATGEQIARAARVEQLRRLVAAGRYHVEPKALAMKILARALRQAE
jgi:anti-sigma28 factor (negative regulator of flagellin synthesis)